LSLEAWRYVRFLTVCEHSAFGPRFSSDEYALDGNVACLRTMDIGFDGRINLPAMPLARLDLAKLQQHVLNPGDLVITRTGAYVGKTAVFSDFSLPVLPGAFLIRFRLNRTIADPWFYHYFFSSPEGQQLIQSIATGSVQPNLNITNLHSLNVPLPLLSEQTAIVRIFGALDMLLVRNRRTNETLEEMSRALFKSWFIDFDAVRAKADGRKPEGMDERTARLFPDSFEESEVGPIPQGWQVKPLPEAYEVNPYRQLTKHSDASYLDMQAMPTVGHRPSGWIQRPFGSGMKFANGDTLVARITPCLENGKTAYVDFLNHNEVGWGSTEYIVLHPKPPLPSEHGYFLARTEDFRRFAIQNMTGTSGRQRVPSTCFSNYPVVIPSSEVAHHFGLFATSQMKAIRRNAEQSSTLAQIREALLPKLLSGELRIKDAERFVEATL
jgi:type I restriction enzyme, S subunit